MTKHILITAVKFLFVLLALITVEDMVLKVNALNRCQKDISDCPGTAACIQKCKQWYGPNANGYCKRIRVFWKFCECDWEQAAECP
ncbi:hypothetical protein FRX31_019091 [Thalictrum thalictroides]|uniref:Defensin-like protein n=1 Tax=Thalictrum thalictroides TaxID=46969 RepID=A0A7J6W4S4_THATH|nr:hypothetical protein FRX31_019091 [Thalictrum thalictroides]